MTSWTATELTADSPSPSPAAPVPVALERPAWQDVSEQPPETGSGRMGFVPAYVTFAQCLMFSGFFSSSSVSKNQPKFG